MDEKQYNEYIKQITPTHNTFLNVLKSHIVIIAVVTNLTIVIYLQNGKIITLVQLVH